ncbi:phage holin family protein [Aquabacter sp. CN5-332]|uniref:phage holin family protein n=1 Tax=Aquabacter sp. CN5-332 TaxID=3156608 RepID=UPI0032B4969D
MQTDARSIPSLMLDACGQFTTLLSKEGRLARAEISGNIAKAANGLSFLVGGAVLLIPALVILMQTAIELMTRQGIDPVTGGALLGGLVLVIGLLFLLVGASRLRVEQVMPDKTIHQLQQDARVAQEQMRPSHDAHRPT